MKHQDTQCAFNAMLYRPKLSGANGSWAFIVLPKDVSATLPRRGRVTVAASINGEPFTVLLEPDGQKSHWMRIEGPLIAASGATIGQVAQFEVSPVEHEPEPEVPADFLAALDAAPESRVTWDGTTTIARLDWIHWITSAKQEKTRKKRIDDACDMLASGKKRVCCFDPSGYYSKAFSAPRTED